MTLSNILTGIMLVLLYASCEKKPSSDNSETISASASDPDTITLVTKTNKKFHLIESHSNGNSTSSVKVVTEGFDIVNDTFDFGDTDSVDEYFIADLDQNGFEELYFVTRGVGSGSYSKIYGLASNSDKSTSQIHVDEDFEDTFFEGYMGHNKYELKNDTLLNVFPIYNSGDTNNNPTGGQKTLKYELKAGEAGWILKPVKIDK